MVFDWMSRADQLDAQPRLSGTGTAGLPGNVDMITGSASLPAYLPTAGRQGEGSSRLARRRLCFLLGHKQ
jgi:hypothetical protein